MAICMVLVIEYRVIFEVVYLKPLSGTAQWCRSKAKWSFQIDAMIDWTLYYASLCSYTVLHCVCKRINNRAIIAQHIKTYFGRTPCINCINKFPFIPTLHLTRLMSHQATKVYFAFFKHLARLTSLRAAKPLHLPFSYLKHYTRLPFRPRSTQLVSP